MKIETTKERILEAAKGCSDAKRVLKTLFPEVFEGDKYFDLSKLIDYPFTDKEAMAAGFNGKFFFGVRGVGKYKYKGFYLSHYYDWSIEVDDEGMKVLVPTNRK